jgi:glyoxylase-like metal-dependent hydrolase (beta-lactamase superfamily II)
MRAEPQQLADGLWRWTAQHPEWHPGEFGREVASFAVQAGDETVLIDPLLPPEPDPVLALIGAQLGGRLSILITIPYHVRSSEEIRRHFRGRAETTIWGHPACRKRLQEQDGFRELAPGDELPAGISAHAIGKPRRHEMPLLLPSHEALVFGDAVAEVDGELRVWADRRVDADVSRFYRERFNPTLEPLLELDFDRVLVTHGSPVMAGGKAELGRALAAEPWYREPEVRVRTKPAGPR